MADVALSRDLIQDIRSKIHALRRTEFDAIKPPEGRSIAPYLGATAFCRQRLIDKLRPEGLVGYDHLFTKDNRLAIKGLPVDIMVYDGPAPDPTDAAAMQTRKPLNSGTAELPDMPVWLRFDTHGKSVDHYDRPRVLISLADVMKHAEEPELVQAWVDVNNAQIECRDRWMKVEKQLLDFLDTCKSLNEALKTLPDIARYVDKHYLDRVEEKRTTTVSKRKVDEEARKAEVLAALQAVDVEVVRTSEVLARMASSSSTNHEF